MCTQLHRGFSVNFKLNLGEHCLPVKEKREMRTVSGVMLALFLVGFLAFSFNVQAVDGEGSWVWVRDTVTGVYGEAVVSQGETVHFPGVC
jgi:hypothetical protein